jgi:hypothetical protein
MRSLDNVAEFDPRPLLLTDDQPNRRLAHEQPAVFDLEHAPGPRLRPAAPAPGPRLRPAAAARTCPEVRRPPGRPAAGCPPPYRRTCRSPVRPASASAYIAAATRVGSRPAPAASDRGPHRVPAQPGRAQRAIPRCHTPIRREPASHRPPPTVHAHTWDYGPSRAPGSPGILTFSERTVVQATWTRFRARQKTRPHRARDSLGTGEIDQAELIGWGGAAQSPTGWRPRSP